MIWKTTLVLSLALCALGHKHAISEQNIKRSYGHHGDLSHIGDHVPEHHEVYASEYPSYEFSYHVDDPHTHDKKSQHEVRDGDKVTGIYWFIQPDGYKRVVKYHSDHKNGFEADVKFIHHNQHHDIKEEHEKRESKEHKIVNREDAPKETRRNLRRKENREYDRRGVQLHHKEEEHKEEYVPRIEIKGRQDLEKLEHKELLPQIQRQQIRERQEKHMNREEIKNNEHLVGHDEAHGKDHDEHDISKELKRVNNDHQSKQYWRGTYNVRKEKEDPREQPIENAKNKIWAWQNGRNEEHWKHGVLVGWREGSGLKGHQERKYDEKRHHDDDHVTKSTVFKDHRSVEDFEDHRSLLKRQNQHSHKIPGMSYKPIVPYGHRLN